MVNARRGTALPLHKSWGRQLPLLPPPPGSRAPGSESRGVTKLDRKPRVLLKLRMQKWYHIYVWPILTGITCCIYNIVS